MARCLRVAARRAEGFPTAVSCRAAGVSHQVFHDWSVGQLRGPWPAELAQAGLVDETKQIHADSGEACGPPRNAAQLRRQGQRMSHKRVERLMLAWAQGQSPTGKDSG